MSVLVLNDLVDEDLFFDTYGEMIVRDWNTLETEIIRRQKNNHQSVRHFTELKKRFLKRIDKENSKRSVKKKVDIKPYCDEEKFEKEKRNQMNFNTKILNHSHSESYILPHNHGIVQNERLCDFKHGMKGERWNVNVSGNNSSQDLHSKFDKLLYLSYKLI